MGGVFEVADTEDPKCVAYKEKDGQMRGGFMKFSTRLAECKTA